MTAQQRGSLRVEGSPTPTASPQEDTMFGRLWCALSLHRVITRSDKPKNGASGPIAVVRGFCYRPHCKFEFARVLKLGQHELT